MIYFFSDFWDKNENKRKLFEDYAASKGFDPLVPENWYNQDQAHILSFKVSPSLS
jgi:hypothetical protein